MKKAIVVWLAVVIGSMIGCSCHHTTHCETGPCPDTGAGAPCSATMPCPSGQSCVANVCVGGGACSATMPCPGGQSCVANVCVPGAPCSATMPCPTGQTCVANVCFAGSTCSATMPCPSGEYCLDGLCTPGAPCSDTMACASGQYCAGGTCALDCSATLHCAGGAQCTADGRCQGGACAATPPITGCGNPCSASMHCPTGLYCGASGMCTGDCSPVVHCSGTQMCSADGHCVGGGADAGVCAGPAHPSGCGAVCTPTLRCSAGTYCFSGHCTADCDGTVPCASGLMCSFDGHCIIGGADGGVTMGACLDPVTGFPDIRLQHCGGSTACTNVFSDPDNCGSCGATPCLASQVCNNGHCASACTSPNTNCSRACVNTLFDSANCGMCGHHCPTHDPVADPMALDEFCMNGVCGCAGASRGQIECSMMCINPAIDRTNCGGCGTVCDTTCASHPDTCASLTQNIGCGQAGDGCGGTIDCGGCLLPGDTCGGGGVPSECGQRDGAACMPNTTAACPAGYCGPYPDGCGGTVDCPTICSAPDTCGGGGVLHRCGRPVCHMSGCLDSCPSDWTNCNHVCLHLSDDARNCGGCGITCGLGTCSGGSCSCDAAQVDANGSDAGRAMCPPGGCIMCPGLGCVNQQVDPQHCGNCGTVCARGQSCVLGRCG